MDLREVKLYSAPVEGRKVMIIGGTHGNELAGIEVVKRLIADFDSGELKLKSGELRLAFGNPAAIEAGERFIDGNDLNRCFAAEVLESGQTVEAERARLLAANIAEVDVLIDIHATNQPSRPFVVSRVDAEHEAVYKFFHGDYVLADPNLIFGGEPVATEEYADSIGKVGVCYEAGFAEDLSRVDEICNEVLMYLASVDLIDFESEFTMPAKPAVYEIVEAVKLEGECFEFADGNDAHSFKLIEKGAVLGQDARGDFVVDDDYYIIFQKKREHQKTGKPVCYLTRKN